MFRSSVVVALAVTLSCSTTTGAHAATVVVSADDYTVSEFNGGDSGTCVMHTFDMTTEYAEGEEQQPVSVVVTDPEGTQVHRLRTLAATQSGIQMSFCRQEILPGTYTIIAEPADPLVEARAAAAADTFLITITRAVAPTAVHQVPVTQSMGMAKVRRSADGFRVKFIGGVNLTTRFTVKVDGRPRRAVTVRAGVVKVRTYEGTRKIRVRASAA